MKLKKSFFHSNLFSIILVLLISLPTYWTLIKPGFFSMHDDIQVMRFYEMKLCFDDGQIPCRWIPDMGHGYGHPLFNYHPVFPYYLGNFFMFLGLSIINAVKLSFFLSLILSGIFMYFLAKEFFGRVGGLISAVAFIYAPYHSVDLYVRGALTEGWGITFFSLILYSFYKFIKLKKLKWFILSSLSLTGLFLSHNLMTLMFSPFVGFWISIWSIQEKRLSQIKYCILAIVLAFCLSAFFIIPSFLEVSLIRVMQNTGYYSYQDHFVTLRQMFFNRDFGYGGSRLGNEDGMSFQLGWPFWWFIPFNLILFFIYFKKKNRSLLLLTSFMLIVSFVAIFFMHAKSVYLWNVIPLMNFVQFPWRFLGLAIFSLSFLMGGLVLFAPKKSYLIGLVIITIVVLLNFGYFKPETEYPNINDNFYLTQENWTKQSRATLNDYVPADVKKISEQIAPIYPWSDNPEVISDKIIKGSNWWQFRVNNPTSKNIDVTIPVFNFPTWNVKDGQNDLAIKKTSENGFIVLDINPGQHNVHAKLQNTPIRTASNMLSLGAFMILCLLAAKLFWIKFYAKETKT